MPEVSITYCVPCRYQAKAIQDADAILKEFGERLTGLRLVPGDNGVYDVHLDGKLVFSLDEAEHFPETADLLESLRTRVPAPRATRGRVTGR
jgi:selenoprotein W-related protein